MACHGNPAGIHNLNHEHQQATKTDIQNRVFEFSSPFDDMPKQVVTPLVIAYLANYLTEMVN